MKGGEGEKVKIMMMIRMMIRMMSMIMAMIMAMMIMVIEFKFVVDNYHEPTNPYTDDGFVVSL